MPDPNPQTRPLSAWELALPAVWAFVFPTLVWGVGLLLSRFFGPQAALALLLWPICTIAGVSLGGAKLLEIATPRLSSLFYTWLLTGLLVIGAFGLQAFLATRMAAAVATQTPP